MTPLSLAFVPSRSPGADASLFGEDFVVLDPAGRTLRGLSPTAKRVWELVDGRRSVREIADQLAREYGQPEPQVREDVLRFLDLLSQKQLIVPSK